MKMISKPLLIIAFIIAGTPAYAGERTVELKVDGMTCFSCPYIVKKTLARVDGVSDVEVSFEKKTAIVTFDDAKTDVEALTVATTDMGFPSALKE